MSRPAAKTRADKGRHGPNAVGNAAITPQIQDVEVEDIIPGVLTQAQWTEMLIQEDVEDMVGEIMDELMNQVMESCMKLRIKKQLAPFTVSWAKTYFLRILEQQLLCRDEGIGPEDAFQSEDTEPLPATPDVWAQGCLPVVRATPAAKNISPQQEADNGQDPGHTKAKQQSEVTAKTNTPSEQSEKGTDPSTPASDKVFKEPSPQPIPVIHRKKKQRSLPPKPVPSVQLPSLSCSEMKKDVKREERSRSATARAAKSLHPPKEQKPSLPKLDSSSLPQHWVTPQYEILNDTSTKIDLKRPGGLIKPGTKHDKQQTRRTPTSSKSLTSSKDEPAKPRGRMEADVWMRKSSVSTQGRERILSPAPLRLSAMDLAKGVSLIEQNEINPLNLKPQALSAKLKPIQSDAPVPLFSVDQFSTGPPPRVTPLFQL